MPTASRIRCSARVRTASGMASNAKSWAKPEKIWEMDGVGLLSLIRSSLRVSDRKIQPDLSFARQRDQALGNIKILNAHAVRFVERDLVARAAAPCAAGDHFPDFRKNIPVHQPSFYGRQQVTAFVASGPA